MIIAELVSLNQIMPKFHSISEQATGTNPASVLQQSKRPRSKDAYILSYYSLFNHPDADPSDIKSLRGLLHVGMVCAGYPEDIEHAVSRPHGLRTLSGFASRSGLAVLFSGDVEQWAGALQSASRERLDAVARDWAASCYSQFAKHDLAELLDVQKPKKVNGYLTYE